MNGRALRHLGMRVIRDGALAAVLVVVAAGPVLADDSGEPIALRYTASADCPDAVAFENLVRGRTTRARFVPVGQTRTFDVLLRGGEHPSGRLTVLRDGAAEGTREVHADSCGEAADALALIAALAVDPTASLGPTPSAPPQPPPVATSNAASTPPEPSSRDVGTEPTARAGPTPPAAAKESAPAPVARSTAPHTLFIGADLVVAGGVPSGPLIGVSPLLGCRSSSTGLIAPSIRASFLRAGSSASDASGGSAAFTWTLGRLDGCVLSWPPGRARLLACARLEAGVVDASASGIPAAQSAGRPWVALGPAVRGEWDFLRPLFLEVDVAPLARLTTYRFWVLPNTTLYDVSTVGLEASAGLGAHFL